MKRSRVLAFVLTCLLGLSQMSPAQAAAPVKTKTPIQHFVFIMQENHTFDNYFGTYPGADGIPAGTKMPVDPQNPQAGFVEPWHIGTATITDLSHNGNTFRDQFDNGKMDGFVSALNLRRENGRTSMGYYDDRDIPYYWNLADHYVLFDRFFSSAPNGSFINHFYSVAAVPPGAENPVDIYGRVRDVPTIFDRLQAAGISWKFYVQNYDPTITYRHLQGVGSRELAGDLGPVAQYGSLHRRPHSLQPYCGLERVFLRPAERDSPGCGIYRALRSERASPAIPWEWPEVHQVADSRADALQRLGHFRVPDGL